MTAWPTARMDPLGRLRALGAGLPGVVMQERLIDAPFRDVWGFVSDLETSVPEFDREVSRVRIVRADGERLRIHTWAAGVPVPLPFDVTVRDQMLWMVSSPRFYVVGMAAIPDGQRTRFGHLEGFAKGARLSRLVRQRQRRHVLRDLDGIERGVARRRDRPSG